ncbi:hypothetical protein ABND66_19965, partial [Paenibacillus larvae]
NTDTMTDGIGNFFTDAVLHNQSPRIVFFETRFRTISSPLWIEKFQSYFPARILDLSVGQWE